MPFEYRAMGKSVQVRVLRNGSIVTEITAIKSLTMTTNQRIITEGYLGESTQREDEIADDISLSFSAAPEGPQILLLQQMIYDRATVRVFNHEKVSMTYRVSFPSGQIARVTVPDLFFDPIPLAMSGRDAYLDVSFTAKATGYLLSV